MSTIPAYWVRFLGILALEAAIFAALAAVVTPWLRAGHRRRWVWQAALMATGITWASELSGVRAAFAGWQHPEVPHRSVVARLVELPTPRDKKWVPAGAESPTREPRNSIWWPAAVWLAGTAGFWSWGLLGRILRRDRCRRGLPAGAATQEAAERLALRLGLGGVQVRVWPGLRGPVAMGHRLASIAIPANFESRFDAVQRDAILAHELAHLAARDGIWMTVADLVCGLAWWHPATWWMRRRLRSDLELAADEASALVPGGRRALAEALVAFGREWKRPAGGRALGVVGGLRSELARRVTALLEAGSKGLEPVRGRGGLTTAAAVAITGVTLGIGNAGAVAGSPVQLFFAEVRSRWVQAPREATVPVGRADSEPVRSGSPAGGLAFRADEPEKSETPAVHLEVKLMEVNEREGTDLGLDWVFGETNGVPASFEIVPPGGYLPEVPADQAVNVRIERGRLEGRTVVLGAAQVGALLRRLESRGDVSIVAAPGVSTHSGRRAQIQVQDARTIVTSAQAIPGEGTNSARVQYTTAPMAFGPTVDIDPIYTNGAWQISVVGTLREFMGYEDPGKPTVVARNADGTEVTGQRPLPVLRVREAIGSGELKIKQSLLLRGPGVREDVKSKAGWFRAAKVQTQQRRLYVLVTVNAVN